mmetsp:Transcript_647/g.458  ORF Transcript_647/g.458 Transcript_647/m.458 type:complete len:97 (-) Transcript_647:11-301(-)
MSTTEAGQDGVFEVEDLLDHKFENGKHHYLVKWQGFAETTWEPDENIGSELAKLKESLQKRRRNGQADRKGEVNERDKKKDKKEKKKKKKKNFHAV